MREPQAMLGSFGVLNTSMALTAIIYAATGFFGFAKFGESVEGSITLNLPQETSVNQPSIGHPLVIFDH